MLLRNAAMDYAVLESFQNQYSSSNIYHAEFRVNFSFDLKDWHFITQNIYQKDSPIAIRI